MKLLSPCRSDAAIYERLVAGTDEDDHYYRGCLRNMLAEPAQEGLFTGEQVNFDLVPQRLHDFIQGAPKKARSQKYFLHY